MAISTIQYYLSLISKSQKQQPCEQQKLHLPPDQTCYLLQLPVELVLIIADFLQPIDLYLFARSCGPLWTILYERLRSARFPRRERFLHLIDIAREKPEKWACWRCIALHPVLKEDTPKWLSSRSFCPKKGDLHGESAYLRAFYLPRGIEHHHVQLALKYTRLQDRKYKSYLRDLLAPYHGWNHRGSNRCRDVSLSRYSKIVKGFDGNPRFLVFMKWRIYEAREIPERGSMEWFLPVCRHIRLNPHNDSKSDYDYILERIVEETFQDRRRHTGACPSCATDFSVRLQWGCLELCVWRDLGTEDSPVNSVVVYDEWGCRWDLKAPNYNRYATEGHHPPGTINELYEHRYSHAIRGVFQLGASVTYPARVTEHREKVLTLVCCIIMFLSVLLFFWMSPS